MLTQILKIDWPRVALRITVTFTILCVLTVFCCPKEAALQLTPLIGAGFLFCSFLIPLSYILDGLAEWYPGDSAG